MNYCHNFFQTIAFLESKNFLNDKIDIETNKVVGHFLDEISDEIQFDNLYFENQKIGISLIKTELNSIGNQVNPEFLETLKRTAKAYLTNLASNWKENTSQNIKRYLKLKNNERVIENEFQKFNSPSFVLYFIAEKWGLREKISTYANSPKIYIYGEEKYLKLFSNILRQESLGGEKAPLSLLHIVCRLICDDLTTYEKSEKFKELPEDLLEKIKAEAIFCLSLEKKSSPTYSESQMEVDDEHS